MRPTPELELAKLPLGSKLLRGSCVTPDGKYACLVHMIGRYWLPVTMVERGWCHNAAMSVFDGRSGKYLNTVLLDDVNLGAAEPWDVIADFGADLFVEPDREVAPKMVDYLLSIREH